MKIHHLRSATLVIESGLNQILVDPMLSERGALPPYALFRHKPRRNPTVPLPENASRVLDKVTHGLITHCQKWGISPLTHTDHLDHAGITFLRQKEIPIVCLQPEAAYLKKHGICVETRLEYWRTAPFLGGEITAIPAQHGHGMIHNLMANGAGYFLRLPDEPSIYISGDTVYTKEVERALTELRPDIAVVAAGGASLDVGRPILMSMKEIIAFIGKSPNRVIANHLEALNHCPTTRAQLKRELHDRGLLEKTFIPADGETLTMERVQPGQFTAPLPIEKQ